MPDGTHDYVGHRVNLAARLCSQARPAGVLICRDDRVIANPGIAEAIKQVVRERASNMRECLVSGLKGIPLDGVGVYASEEVDLG